MLSAFPVLTRAELGPDTVHLHSGDAGTMTLSDLLPGRFDAILMTYTISIIEGYRHAWDSCIAALEPAGRIALVDLGLPQGRWVPLRLFARLACFTGGADPTRAPWELSAPRLRRREHRISRGGHVHIVAWIGSGDGGWAEAGRIRTGR